MSTNYEIVWHHTPSQISGRIIDDNVRLFAANEAKRLMTPYVPAQNLALSQNTRVFVDGKVGVIHYTSPYAHYQWEGKLYVDKITGKGAFTDGTRFWSRPGVAKVNSGRDLKHSKFRHPLATSHWDKAMLAAHKKDLADAIERYIKR